MGTQVFSVSNNTRKSFSWWMCPLWAAFEEVGNSWMFEYNLKKKPFLLILRQCPALLNQADSAFCRVIYYFHLWATFTKFFEYWWSGHSEGVSAGKMHFTLPFVDKLNSSRRVRSSSSLQLFVIHISFIAFFVAMRCQTTCSHLFKMYFVLLFQFLSVYFCFCSDTSYSRGGQDTALWRTNSALPSRSRRLCGHREMWTAVGWGKKRVLGVQVAAI